MANPENIVPFNYKPGTSGYGEYLKSLTEAEREAHRLVCRQRRVLRATMKEALENSDGYWVPALQEAAMVQVQKAIKRGDTQAFQAAWDRIIGKPESTVDLTVGKADTIEDIVAQLKGATLLELTKKEDDHERNSKE